MFISIKLPLLLIPFRALAIDPFLSLPADGLLLITFSQPQGASLASNARHLRLRECHERESIGRRAQEGINNEFPRRDQQQGQYIHIYTGPYLVPIGINTNGI